MPALIDMIAGRPRGRGPSAVAARRSSMRRPGGAPPKRSRADEATLLGLWGEAGAVHMAMLAEASGEIAVVSLRMPEPDISLGRRAASAGHPPRARDPRSVRPGAGRPARRAAVARSRRLGRDAIRSANAAPRSAKPAPYDFLPAEGEGLHQIPVGPVHAGIIEPGHFRFTANGETVVRLEERLGYVHKGIEWLMAGATLDKAARLAGPRLRRQHGRLCARLRARGRSGARRRGAAARAFICAR